ncbi:TsaC protein (YrdC domain) required for threonylcarbamoyladenosine t(6)A37 modification in tRNA [hydrothermal vent metagenome]|uniref:TsaC protein (YrdC domain) required for threonylcarbamoyladenosine t(6)A37 modification in tRNA n=1 Tax=hydrothermal vent metagenome TaxID=652676 RepID=A0A1W1C9N0_9ZZZZ
MKTKLYLTQTDTTIGFVSQDASKIDKAKNRLSNKYYIRVVNSLETLKRFTRVPQKHKNRLRRAKKTTFIMPNGLSFRVVKDTEHNLLLNRLHWVYSSSANLSGAEYDEKYARDKAEVIVTSPIKKNGLASKIYRLGQKKMVGVRL